MGRLAWYKAPKGQVHSAVAATIGAIKAQQSLQRLDIMHYLDLYSLGNVAGVGRSLSDLTSYYDGNVRGLRGARFNMCAAVVDTAHSMIAASPSIPIYITSGTDLGTVRKAERRSKVLQSQVNDLAIAISRRAFHTACKTGTGAVFGFLDEQGLPKLEHVNPLELLVDHYDGFYGTPRSIHREKYIHRDELAELAPSNKKTRVERTAGVAPDYISRFFLAGVQETSDMVTVWESWWRPLNPDKPGRHVISCSSCDLLDEPWDEDLPFAFVRYRVRDFGFFGSGLAESAREAQNRVNRLIRRVAKAQDLASNLLIFNPMGPNQLEARWLTNEIGLAFDFDPGLGPPLLQKWDGTLDDLQAQIDTEFARILQVEGLSDAQVSGEGAGKGLSSGVAVRAQDDVMSRRLINPVELFQGFNVEVARLIERLNDRAADINEDYVAKGYQSVAGVNFIRSSRWLELDIPEGEACLNLMPMSIVPTTPAGKWAAVSEWLQNGFLDKTGAMKLLQFPAIDESALLETAQLDLCLWQMEKLLDGELVLPEERQDLSLCLTVGTKVWARAQMMNPSDAVQFALEEYLAHAETLLEAMQPKAPGAGGAPPGAAQLPPPPMGGITPAPAATPAQAA